MPPWWCEPIPTLSPPRWPPRAPLRRSGRTPGTEADATAQRALDEAIAAEPFPNEPAIARAVFAGIPDHGLLYASSSMPIRDVDAFGGHRGDGSSVTVLANRGANGIDGVISSALGAAAYGAPVTALVGDVAALHDLNALATTVRLDLPVTIVVVHNDGGGIFSFLPQADPTRFDPDVFERHLGTPHGTDFGAVATALGMKVEQVDTADALERLGRRRLRPDPGRVPHRPDRERRRPRPTRAGGQDRARIDGGSIRAGRQVAVSRSRRGRSFQRVSTSSRSGSESATMPLPA